MNRIRETIEVAEPLWRALEQMSHDLGVDRNALVAQALFLLARQNGYVAPTPVALGVTVAGEPVRAPAARAPEPVVRPVELPAAAAVPVAAVVPAKETVAAAVPAKETVAAAPAAAVSEPVKARTSVDEAAQARARMQEVLAAVDAVAQPRDVPVASEDEEEADEEEDSDADEASDDDEAADDEAADESSDDEESDEAADETSDDEAADDASDDEAADESSDDEESDDESSDDEESDEAADESSDDEESEDEGSEDDGSDAAGAADEASDDEDSSKAAGSDDEDASQASEEDDAFAADIAAAIGSEGLPDDKEADDSEPEEARTGEEATGSEEDAAAEEPDARAASSSEDEAQDPGADEPEEQNLPFVAPPATKAPAPRRQGRVLRSAPEDDAPPESHRSRKPVPRAPARMDLFVRLSPDGDATRVDVERFTLGRGPQCSLVVKSGRVSREHAVVTREGADYFIEDLGSSNGTWINHQRIKRQKIADGDTFNLGTEAVYFSLQPAGD
ncbi:FHA domain-containing protein [Corallococcus sp. AS-1-6]|uniref:FHA domain-containing protein n=1 Tax=Corallococcus sp. AS-1-6 TaxID=2874599 RepID=UPI001CBC452E|nr:FHA domain-containing protein [Corallococcus sp. AS-1-6]MBZ4376449.1 FHA domain-containing protein [Corallococcus sp. AS-1-6]